MNKKKVIRKYSSNQHLINFYGERVNKTRQYNIHIFNKTKYGKNGKYKNGAGKNY